MKSFKNGLTTGLILQLAIGPGFFFIANLALQKSLFDGLAGALAITTVDYLYITLSIFGVSKLLENKRIKKAFGIISSIVLIIFGIIIIKSITINSASVSANTTNVLSSFISAFLLTVSSPLTIVCYTGIFTAKAIEFNYSKKDLIIFGLAVGLATPMFLVSSVILLSLIKQAVPLTLMQILNSVVGALLISYGVIRILRIQREI